MLVHLSIRNIVLIEKLDLSFQDGLFILTGETGAGKSILLDSLGLALGARAETRLVRAGAEQASVSALFDLPSSHQVFASLAENGLDADGEIILRRTLTATGKSRAFINDQAVSATLLKEIGQQLIEIHGQYDTQTLLNSKTHRSVLDQYSGHESLLLKTQKSWDFWKALEHEELALKEEIKRAKTEEDFLQHAVRELEELSPEEGEEEILLQQRAFLMNSEQISQAMVTSFQALTAEGGCEDFLVSAQAALEKVSEKTNGQFDDTLAALDRAATEIKEAVHHLQQLHHEQQETHTNLEEVDGRLFALRSCARKHGLTIDQLPEFVFELKQRLNLIENQDSQLADLNKRVQSAKKSYVDAAEKLSKSRKKNAQKLDKGVSEELAPLKMAGASFITQISLLEEPLWTRSGTENITFTIATNAGAKPGPLNKIASGGELARFMVALKVNLTQSRDPNKTVGTMVFDEVDTGIGGAVADAVGERLARLAQKLQLLVITHSPQVAARGNQHLRVSKAKDGNVTTSSVEALNQEERLEEIARMLSGAKISTEARAAASSLLQQG